MFRVFVVLVHMFVCVIIFVYHVIKLKEEVEGLEAESNGIGFEEEEEVGLVAVVPAVVVKEVNKEEVQFIVNHQMVFVDVLIEDIEEDVVVVVVNLKSI